MKNILFQSNIKNGVIKVPRKYKNLENSSVKVVVLEEKGKNKNTLLKKKLKSGLLSLQKMDSFNKIKDPVIWQKKLRDEW